jgi:hypothetical protein
MHPDRVMDCSLTDGETSERQWSFLGRYHYILKETRPENREEILEDLLSCIYFDTHSGMAKTFKAKSSLRLAHIADLEKKNRPPDHLDLRALRANELQLLSRNSEEREYSGFDILNIEIRQLYLMMEDARSLLIFRPILPAGTRSSTSIQATVNSMKEKLLGLIESRNLLPEATQSLTMDDLQNRDSWFWSQDLQELEETGINQTIRNFIDFDQKALRIQEEELLLISEKDNFNRNISDIITRLQNYTLEQGSSRFLQALDRYKEEKIIALQSWKAL